MGNLLTTAMWSQKHESEELYQAAKDGDLDKARVCLSKQANPNWNNPACLFGDMVHRTPLMIAAERGNLSIVEELVQSSTTDVNFKSSIGWTALDFAVLGGYSSVVDVLLRHGTNIDPRAMQMAKQRAFSEIASLLAKHDGNHTEAKFLKKGRFYPVYVCKKEDFLRMERLMKHEVALEKGHIVELPEGAVVLFFSHRWLEGQKKDEEGPHPDNGTNMKLLAMQHAISHFPAFSNVTHVWVDFLSVPQYPEHSENQLFGINSLPFIVRQCSMFVVMKGKSEILNGNGLDEGSFEVYSSRGWCRLECLSAIAPLDNEEEGRKIMKYMLDMNSQAVESLNFGSAKDFNPFGDDAVFFDKKDKKKISLMVFNLAKRFDPNFEGISEILERAPNFFPAELKEKYTRTGHI